MPTLVATPGAPDANSFATLAEAATYFDERIPLPTPWVASGDASVRALIMAARVLDGLAVSRKTLQTKGTERYYITSPQWTGLPATQVQRLTWPRVGMLDRNGNPIAPTVLPRELKDAQSELAGQLLMSDTTLDNAVAVGGIKSIGAGSVSLSFSDMIARHVVPDAVMEILVPSWLTDEGVDMANEGIFDVVSR